MVLPLRDIYVTAEFGRPGSWAAGYHTGIDYRAAVGTNVYATKGGVVRHAGWGGYGSAYGEHVVIQSWHNGARRQHLYAHMSEPVVRTGERVKTGQWIGKSGVSGNVTGPHVHYEERVSPFGYYNHRRPVLPGWKPVSIVTVSLNKVRPGLRNRHIRRVQRRLNRRFSGLDRLKVDGFYGTRTKHRVARWQTRLGYDGADANGVAGRKSLEKLGFRVIS